MRTAANDPKARRWFAMVIGGKTFSEIAGAEGRSKRRVQDIIDLAMLAPDLLDAVATDEQPDRLTRGCQIETGFSALWSEQYRQFAGP